MLWHIELKFYIWLCLTVLQIKFEFRQFTSIFVGVMPLSGLTGNTQLYTCIDKFSWNLKFHVGFFNAFLLCFRKLLYKNSPLKCSRRAYYAPFAVLRYIFNFLGVICCFSINIRIEDFVCNGKWKETEWVECKSLRSAWCFTHKIYTTHVLSFPIANKKVYFNPSIK